MNHRSDEPRLVVGVQPVRELLKARGREVSEVVLLERAPRLAGLAKLAEDVGSRARFASASTLDRLARGATHQGAVAFGPPLQLVALPSPEREPLVLALDGVQDPQNFGAAIRSAVGVAKAPVLWSENASAPLTPATFRASAGAIEHAQLCRVPSLPRALQEAAAEGFQVIGLDAHADTPLSAVDLTQPSILVVGGEGRGLGRATRRACTVMARLVLPHTIDSLNASVSAALALYEAQSQRQRREQAVPKNTIRADT